MFVAVIGAVVVLVVYHAIRRADVVSVLANALYGREDGAEDGPHHPCRSRALGSAIGAALAEDTCRTKPSGKTVSLWGGCI